MGIDRSRLVLCSDCGASSDTFAIVSSRFGGDPVCLDCEATRSSEAELRGTAAVACDPSTLLFMATLGAWGGR